MIAVVLIAGGVAGVWVYSRRAAHQDSEASNAYVDAAVCADCHGEIAASYRKTGMGRSLARVRQADMAEFGKPLFNKVSRSALFILVAVFE